MIKSYRKKNKFSLRSLYLPNPTCTSWVRKHGLDKDFTQRAAMNLTFDLKFTVIAHPLHTGRL